MNILTADTSRRHGKDNRHLGLGDQATTDTRTHGNVLCMQIAKARHEGMPQ